MCVCAFARNVPPETKTELLFPENGIMGVAKNTILDIENAVFKPSYRLFWGWPKTRFWLSKTRFLIREIDYSGGGQKHDLGFQKLIF